LNDVFNYSLYLFEEKSQFKYSDKKLGLHMNVLSRAIDEATCDWRPATCITDLSDKISLKSILLPRHQEFCAFAKIADEVFRWIFLLAVKFSIPSSPVQKINSGARSLEISPLFLARFQATCKCHKNKRDFLLK